MNANVNRNDFLFFQNEVYKDLKELEMKINEKINVITSNINSNRETSDNHYQKFGEKISQMIKMIETSEERLKINEQIRSFQKKIDDFLCMNKAKTTSLEREINKITFKYDKIFLDNLTVPGIIGTACPFQNLSSFIEYANKKIKELVVEKTKQNTDLSSYKEKLEALIGAFNNQIKNVENKFAEFCNKTFENYDKNCNERNNALEEKIQNMRVENGKYSYDLIEKTNELKIKWEKLQNFQDEIYNKFNRELAKHVHMNNNLCKIFNSQRDEFKLLKSRFTELSEFIKDVRFRNNINNANNANNFNNLNNNNYNHETEFEKKVKFRNMSRRINFNLRQKLNTNDKNDNSLDEINKKFDYLDANKEHNFNQSYSDIFDNSHYNNKYKHKNNLIINKPMNLRKISSTLKNYFNQNKEYKTSKNKNNIFSNFIDNKKDYKSENENNIEDNKIKESEEDELKLKSILKKRKALLTAKNIIKKSTNMILTIDDKNNKNNQNESFNLETKQKFVNKSYKILPLLSLKNRSLTSMNNNKSRNNDINVKLNDEINSKGNRRRSLLLQFNNNLKMEKLDNDFENNKGGSNNNLKTYTSESKDLFYYHSNFEMPTLSLNEIENNLNSSFNKNFQKKKNNINININETNNINNLNTLSSKDEIKIKNKNFSNNDNSLINNEHNFNFENDNKLVGGNFSFLTNIKESPNAKMKNQTNINELNIKFDLLNKKINKTNKRLNETYRELDIKINRLYKYMKKKFGDLTGRLFFKETNNYNFFNSHISPNKILTTTNYIMPIPEKKRPINSNDNDKNINKKNYFSPNNLKTISSFKSIVNKIEPYLIKKFKT